MFCVRVSFCVLFGLFCFFNPLSVFRIYIKKVRKFLDYDVGVRDEASLNKRKCTKYKMDRFFKDLKFQLAGDDDLDELPLRAEDR